MFFASNIVTAIFSLSVFFEILYQQVNTARM